MEKHTKKTIKTSWSDTTAQSRAIRTHTSAPLGKELANYKRLFKKYSKRKKDLSVLILGATPELRDLAIEHNAQTLAIDLSLDMLSQMTAVMKHRNSLKNQMMKGDWLEIDTTLAPKSFDFVFADASLNNVPAKIHKKIFANLSQVLKPKGYFITRNYVYQPERPKVTIDEIQKLYNQKRVNWLFLWIHLGLYNKHSWAKNLYSMKTCNFQVGKTINKVVELINEEKLKVTKLDRERIKNNQIHASRITHIALPEKMWNKIVNKHFKIVERSSIPGLIWTEYTPIWVLKKR